jgi:AIPR protein
MKRFLALLNKQVSNYQKKYKLPDGKAFGMWLAIEYLGLDDNDAFEAVSVDSSNDKDIDLFFVDDEAQRVVIGQQKFKKDGRYKGSKNELLGLIHTTDWLKDPESFAREGRPDLESAARDYQNALAAGYSVEYIYAYCGPEKKEVLDTARQFNVTEAGNIPSRFCKVMALETLKTLHEESINQSMRVPSCEITLSKFFEEDGAYGEAIVSTIDGAQLRELYEEHGDRLFDRNVRLFLGARKGGVNAGIRDTLGSPTDRKNFWAYNNGLTFICDDFTQPNKSKMTLRNFSVVNGCQTTVSLANATTETLRDVRVPVRFIRASERVIDSIITYNNSQNPIRLWDLNSQDKLQKKLKKQLASMPQPFFYALRKGEIQKLTESEKSKFRRDGKIQQIPHDVNAQFIAAFRGLPAIGYKDKGKVFSIHRDEVFPPQVRPEEVVLIWQAGRVCKELVRKELEHAIHDDDETRVAILKRGAPFFVLAIVGMLLHDRNGQTFLNKLKPEVAASKRTIRRLTNYATIALEWYAEAMREFIDAGQEVASLVRSQEGWRKVRPKIKSKWRVYSLAKDVVENSLPKL